MRVGIFLREPRFFTPGEPTLTCLAAVGANTGNMVFLSSVIQLLPKNAELLGWDCTLEELKSFDVMVVPAANFLTSQLDFGFLEERFRLAGVPTLVLGLGLQAIRGERVINLPEGTVAWLQAITGSAAAGVSPIHVRGQQSQDLLERHGVDSVVSGCPSLFLNDNPTLGESLSSRYSLSDPASSSWASIPAGIGHPHAAGVDRILMRLAERSSSPLPWILQDDEALIKLLRCEYGAEDGAALKESTWHHAPWLEPADFASWVGGNGAFFLDASSYGEHLRRFDFVHSARIHGAILAIQSGSPSVVVGHDARVVELATTCKLPCVLPNDSSVVSGALMRNGFKDWDGRAFDMNRGRLALRLVDAFRSFGIPVPTGLGKVLSAASTSDPSVA